MSVHIVNCGTQSPLGTWTSMSAANVRAGLARITVHPEYEDSMWSPIKVAMADYLDTGIPNMFRFLKLGLDALKETITPLKEIEAQLGIIPLLVGLPEKRDGLQDNLQSKFEERLIALEKDCNVTFQTEFFPFDHASGLIAMKEGMNHLENGDGEFCIAGGIESYINRSTLSWLEEQGQLKCSDNKWGMTPGEGAGFCLLSTLDSAKKYNLPVAGELLAIAETEEKTKDGEVSIGQALSQSFKNVFCALSEDEKIHQVLCDMNGQRHRADEYGYSILRLNKYFEAPQDFIAPANLWGDLGAASAPLLTGLATESGRKGYAKGPNNLIFTMSPNGKRAAALIRLNEN